MMSTTCRDVSSGRVAAAAARLSRLALAALSGQHSDVNGRASTIASLESARDITARKSGLLGRAAAETGAILATEDASIVSQIGEFGEQWATVLQIVNDVAGVWPGGARETDLALGRMTVPIAIGLQGSSDARSGRFVELLAKAGHDSGAEREARALLWETGAIHKSWALAGLHYAKASRIAGALRARNPHSRLHELLGN
jgi:geranylgeranyl pyrophosphate synthase